LSRLHVRGHGTTEQARIEHLVRVEGLADAACDVLRIARATEQVEAFAPRRIAVPDDKCAAVTLGMRSQRRQPGRGVLRRRARIRKMSEDDAVARVGLQRDTVVVGDGQELRQS
jgi:hypothetical protein